MHLIRRSAFRAIHSSSISSRPRTISTSLTILLRSRKQATVSPIFRRFASDEAAVEKQKEESSKSSPADSEGRPAIESTAETVSPYASDAAASTGSFRGEEGRDLNSRGRHQGYSSDRTRSSRYEDRDHRKPLDLVPSAGIYVGNLRFDIVQSEVEEIFAEYGDVQSVRLIADGRGLSKGFAYVTYASVEQADAAIRARSDSILHGRRLVVNYMVNQRTPSARPASLPSKCLFIGNLAFEMSDSDLNKLFRDIRNVVDVRVAIDRRTGQPRGFAHADFVDIESATAGLELLRGKEVYGRKLRVDFSAAPEPRWRDNNRDSAEPKERY